MMFENLREALNLSKRGGRDLPAAKFFAVAKNLSGHRLIKIFC
jgi:hypothetical protein